MTLQFDDILAAICTEVKPSHANDYQKVYLLSSDVEAKLAFDVLVAMGFNAKFYTTPGNKTAKLYVANPTIPPEQVEERLSAGIAYMRMLKTIKITLDGLCDGNTNPLLPGSFTMAFVNAQPSGKQLMIQLSQQAANYETQAAAPESDLDDNTQQAGAPVPTVAARVAAQPVTASSARVSKKYQKKKEEGGLTAGPAVGRGLYPGSKSGEKVVGKETLRKRIMLRMFGNFATSGYATLLWLVIVGFLFTAFVFAKAFICYDFVAKKSTKWYCQDPGAMQAAEDARKAEIAERQKKLGLAPVDQPPQR